MNLHRVEHDPDWAAVSPGVRNIWQKLAAATNGIVTLGNLFSLMGLLSVPVGLYLMNLGDTPLLKYVAFFYAIPVLALGRICDLLDGWLADRTGTKSPLGEKIDASFDKISTAGILIGLVVLHVIDWWILALLILPHILVAAVALLAYSHGRGLHPSRIGKNSMAVAWACLFVYITSYAFEMFSRHGRIPALQNIAAILLAVSVFMGLVSLQGYVREYQAAR